MQKKQDLQELFAEVVQKLQTSNLKSIERRTGLHYNTIIRLKNGIHANPSIRILNMINEVIK